MRVNAHNSRVLRPLCSLVVLVASVLVAFGWRTALQIKRHGDSGWRFGRDGVERVVGPLLVASLVLVVGAPVVALIGGSSTPVWGPAWLVAGTPGLAAGWIGLGLSLAGAVLTVVAQTQMGASWRIGVQRGEQTELVTTGLFAHVRNPIFTGMALVAVGGAVLVPDVLAVAGAVLLVVALEMQVRLVEEPNLRDVHGAAYERWAISAGRFVPGVGRGV